MNYSDLKTEITDWAHRSNVSGAKVQTFIELAEAEFNVRLRTVDQETVAELVCSSRYTALPSDFLEMRAVEYQGSVLRNLTYATPDFIAQWRSSSPTGESRAYTLRGTYLELLPTLGSDDPEVDGFGSDVAPYQSGEVPITLHYWAKIPALSDSNTSNWLLASHPNMYLYECLRQLAIYTKDDASIQRYANLMQGYFVSLTAHDIGKRFGGSALAIRVS